jgi:hypothetical protein
MFLLKEWADLAYFTESSGKTAVKTGLFRVSCLLEGRNSCGEKTIVLQNTTSRRGKNRGETEIVHRDWKLDFEKK